MASAILDDKTGELLEYHHLMKHPKYKNLWMKLFGTEICHLITTTETIFFQIKCKINLDDARISHMAASSVYTPPRRRILTVPKLQWAAIL